ncbi:MAG: endo-1,4-beta-xylanase [Phycisphaeraceae bacterium JB051]
MHQRITFFVTLLCAFCFGLSQSASAQTTLFENADWLKLQQSNGDQTIAKMQWINTDHPKFNKAVRMDSKQAMRHSYNIQFDIDIHQPIGKGDVLMLDGYIRLVQSKAESGEGLIQVQVQRNHKPYTKLLMMRLPLTDTNWRRVQVPFVSKEAYKAGQTNVCLCIGDYVQTIEAGGFTLMNLGNSVDVQSLPSTERNRLMSYEGREPDAAWREVAAKNIEKLRKGNLKITVTNAAGKPIPGATVDVQMTQHAFKFGTAVHSSIFDPYAKFWTSRPDDTQKFLQIVKDNFNIVTHESNLKWPRWIEPARRKAADKLIDWLMENDIALRGHAMVWPGWSHGKYPHVPQHIVELTKDPANRDKVAQMVLDHITNIGQIYGEKVTTWDVINEPTLNDDLTRYLGGDDIFIDWFKAARKAAPNARLVLNETTGGTVVSDQYFYSLIKKLVDNDTPIDAVGFQSHFGQTSIGIPQFLELLDKYAALGLMVDISEFDIEGYDAKYRADYTRDFMTACFSHPAVDTFIVWGFWAQRHWRPERAMYDKDWNITPNGKAWLDLVKNQWWTNQTGKTNDNGAYQLRGFNGKYQITVTTPNGKTVKQPINLTREGQTVVIKVTQ